MKKQSWEFIKKYSLTKNNLSSKRLIQIFSDFGYQVVYFNRLHNCRKTQELIDSYELNDLIKNRRTFVLNDFEIKLLFIHECIGEDELIHYLLHEVGHIWLKHNNTHDEDLQEREADEFAVYVKILLEQRHKLLRIAMLPCVFIVLLLVFSVNEYKAPVVVETTPTPIISTQPPIVSDSFYITKSGDKFHTHDCMYVKNKIDIIEISKEQAETLAYEPCKICNPNN